MAFLFYFSRRFSQKKISGDLRVFICENLREALLFYQLIIINLHSTTVNTDLCPVKSFHPSPALNTEFQDEKDVFFSVAVSYLNAALWLLYCKVL
jgi:hypothetical protein